jgi:anhydro-N-acetylmuramic acid kinase
MSGSSLDGLDVAFVVFQESGGKWSYHIEAAECLPFSSEWENRLRDAITLSAKDYLLLHSAFGHYIGHQVNAFIEKYRLQHRVQLISSHGHTTFHMPEQKMTGQIGDGAAIAAVTGINTVSDLRALDVALGGQGAPIVPMGEKMLLSEFPLLLNLGGIANISASLSSGYIAYDVCPANRVLNMLAAEKGMPYDAGGQLASSGTLRDEALAFLNQLPFYAAPFPKSLANDFGTDVVFPVLKKYNLGTTDALRTMVEHIAIQITRNIGRLLPKMDPALPKKVLVTGGGAYNTFLVDRMQSILRPLGVELSVPDENLILYKEALIMALLGVLRWREEATALHTVTGASFSSVGGCVWMGQ